MLTSIEKVNESQKDWQYHLYGKFQTYRCQCAIDTQELTFSECDLLCRNCLQEARMGYNGCQDFAAPQ